MTAPVIVSCQLINTQLALIFDRAVTATTAAGISATVSPTGATNAVTFVGVAGNTVNLTIATPLLTGQQLDVSTTSGTTIVDALTGLSPATPFTKTAVTAYVIPTVLQAVVGRLDNSDVMLQFSRPVASPTANLAAGFSVTVDTVPVTGTLTATLSPNQTRLYIQLPANVNYNSTVVVTYDKSVGDLYTQLLPLTNTLDTTVGSAGSDTVTVAGSASVVYGSIGSVVGAAQVDEIESFSITAVNQSTTGLPNSAYPLSTILKAAPKIVNGVVQAQLTVSLNPVDRVLVSEYGPVKVSTGGTFGITETTPSGIYAMDSLALIVDGAIIRQTFTSGTHPQAAVEAAKDWATIISGAIGQALGQIRAMDTEVGPLVDGAVQI